MQSNRSSVSVVSVIIAIFAFVLSVVNFYFSFLCADDIEIIPGEYVRFCYDRDGTFCFNLEMTFVNHGTRLGTVQRVAILIQQESDSDGYLMEPRYYQIMKQNDPNAGSDYMWVSDSPAAPVAVPGHQTENRCVLFAASADYVLKTSGKYSITVLGWTKGDLEPAISTSFDIRLDPKNLERLNDYRKSKSSKIEELRQLKWSKWQAHLVTEVEVRKLKKVD
jgi:hypothetical protein